MPNQDQDDIGEAVDGVEHADRGMGEAALALEEVGDGADGIVDVVVAEEGEGDEGHGSVVPGLNKRVAKLPGSAEPQYNRKAAQEGPSLPTSGFCRSVSMANTLSNALAEGARSIAPLPPTR